MGLFFKTLYFWRFPFGGGPEGKPVGSGALAVDIENTLSKILVIDFSAVLPGFRLSCRLHVG